ncbi:MULTISPECIES: S-formylglutathione hydrolase [Modicisalibacter]|uniref:S-formylglutathione hydrolase n=1 Tax=Modicisalibacter TaxID=574347 RepID=UPI00100BD69B|nr:MULTISPECIES: S-formylglutathione hydrolase [Halomonadaceae]MBZ9559354.1 S-formylglutathione hydrolase [Modicisalibacter sp. R2A 31.J]MBZ9576481.1 S-formylglutathione hydrolase [Modicisalibacter sp. MOD 31.J]
MSMSETLELVSATKSFGGWLKRYKHHARSLDCEMVFAIYLPPQAEEGKVPLLWWLSGLTCTDENFMQKAGAQRLAAELGMAIVCPDTSPRGLDLPGEHDSYDFGSGAGFYVNAKREPWSRHYRMYDYVNDELPSVVRQHFPVNGREAISGHSMGGHGALVLALRQPGRFASVSAFAPVVNPSVVPWGQKAFTNYLGDDHGLWTQYDACELVAKGVSRQPLFIDQGEADNFLEEQLRPERLEAVCEKHDHPLTLRRQPGYDHSYFFIATFIDDHLRYHAKHLKLL